MRGKLVPQDPSDEPVSELPKRIAAEKAKMIANRLIRRSKDVSPLEIGKELFEVPNSWTWCRLDEVFFVVTDGAHHTPRYVNGGIPFLSVKDVSSGEIRFDEVRFISPSDHGALCQRCRPQIGDILLTKVGTTGIAVPVETDREFSIFVSVALLKFSQRDLHQRFLCHLINSPFVRKQSADKTQGIGHQNLVLRLIKNFALPVPPLAEQRRIVAKVDELIALCDGLEASLASGDVTRRRLLDVLLAEALTPANPTVMEAVA